MNPALVLSRYQVVSDSFMRVSYGFEILVLLVSCIDVLISWYQDEVMILVLALIRGWDWE